MVSDSLSNIEKYYDILPSLKGMDHALSSYQESMDAFDVNRKYSTLFVVESGTVSVATTWREVMGGRDVTGAMQLEKGDFVLFLPKEQFLVKGDGRVLKYVLE